MNSSQQQKNKNEEQAKENESKQEEEKMLFKLDTNMPGFKVTLGDKTVFEGSPKWFTVFKSPNHCTMLPIHGCSIWAFDTRMKTVQAVQVVNDEFCSFSAVSSGYKPDPEILSKIATYIVMQRHGCPREEVVAALSNDFGVSFKARDDQGYVGYSAPGLLWRLGPKNEFEAWELAGNSIEFGEKNISVRAIAMSYAEKFPLPANEDDRKKLMEAVKLKVD
jgi:hypothetical protein